MWLISQFSCCLCQFQVSWLLSRHCQVFHQWRYPQPFPQYPQWSCRHQQFGLESDVEPLGRLAVGEVLQWNHQQENHLHGYEGRTPVPTTVAGGLFSIIDERTRVYTESEVPEMKMETSIATHDHQITSLTSNGFDRVLDHHQPCCQGSRWSTWQIRGAGLVDVC